jgi:PadR family transcriptional regulator, regulatory protein PadR
MLRHSDGLNKVGLVACPPASCATLYVNLGECVATTTELLQGTLDLLILKAVSLGPLHGYGVLLRIQQISRDKLKIQQGSLYPALYRLEHQGLITSEWGESENRRKAKYYRLTAAGRRRMTDEQAYWKRFSEAMTLVLDASPGDI